MPTFCANKIISLLFTIFSLKGVRKYFLRLKFESIDIFYLAGEPNLGVSTLLWRDSTWLTTPSTAMPRIYPKLNS